MKFHNPYQFVAVSTKDTDTLEWHKDAEISREENAFVRHDYWHEKGLSGTITASLKTLSPTVIGGKQTAGVKASRTHGTVTPYRDCQGRLAIPGNSLRGMISSIAEIVSCSSMRVLDTRNDESYSLRMQTSEAYKSIGLLFMDNDQWYIYPIESIGSDSTKKPAKFNFDSLGSYKAEEHKPLPSKLMCYHGEYHNKIVPCKAYLSDGLHENYKGVHYIRGEQSHMEGVHQEKCFKWDGKVDKSKGIHVPDYVISELESTLKSQYEALAKQNNEADDDKTPTADLLPKGYRDHKGKDGNDVRWKRDKKSGKKLEHEPRILPGDLLYFKYNDNRTNVVSMGFSAIGRRVAQGSLVHAFKTAEGENSLPWGKSRTELTPAERLFGVVEYNVEAGETARSLASRLRFADAPIDDRGDALLMDSKTLKVLNSPKPPSPSMYFSVHSDEYISKSNLNLNEHRPNGRKRYLPHHPEKLEKGQPYRFETQSKNRDDDDKYRPWMHMTCNPVDAGAKFTVSIRFDNLMKEELDLLLFCLRPDDDFIHRLGLGKPLGLGHVDIGVINVKLVDRKQRYTPESIIASNTSPNTNYTFDREQAFSGLVSA